MPNSCEQISSLLSGLVDNELDQQKAAAARSHLDSCTKCADFYELQIRIKDRLKNEYRIETTPVHLRARIRRNISNTLSFPGFFKSLAEVFSLHKIKGAFAAAMLLFLIAMPYGEYIYPDASPINEPRYVSVEGKVLCVDCEVMQTAGHEAVCAPDHHLGLKDESGKVWDFVNASLGKQLVHKFALIDKLVQIEGYIFPGGFSNKIDVQRFNEL